MLLHYYNISNKLLSPPTGPGMPVLPAWLVCAVSPALGRCCLPRPAVQRRHSRDSPSRSKTSFKSYWARREARNLLWTPKGSLRASGARWTAFKRQHGPANPLSRKSFANWDVRPHVIYVRDRAPTSGVDTDLTRLRVPQRSCTSASTTTPVRGFKGRCPVLAFCTPRSYSGISNYSISTTTTIRIWLGFFPSYADLITSACLFPEYILHVYFIDAPLKGPR